MSIPFERLIEENKEIFYEDLDQVMQINSVKGNPTHAAPFGNGPKEALDLVLQLAKTYGFKTGLVNDAVGYAQWGEDDQDYIGIVGHLDVVPEGTGWSVPPFKLTKKGKRFYGRGVLDNKGPILACLFGLHLLKQLNLPKNKTIRIIFGTDEESGSGDIPLYLEKEAPPTFGFTPDCKYPVVYGERGIVNYAIHTPFSNDQLEELGEIIGDQGSDHVPDELTTTICGKKVSVTGKRAPSNAPSLGENAITLLAEKIQEEQLLQGELGAYFAWIAQDLAHQHEGQGLGIDFEDEDSGKTMMTPYQLEKKSDGLVLSLAVRYPVSLSENQLTQALVKHLPDQSQVEVIRRLESCVHPKEDSHIQKLVEVYEKVTGEDGTPVTTTGATYARTMPNIVAFGPSFPGQKGIAHNKDEYMDEADLLLNMRIYMEAMWSLIQ
ncbi:Sapep family Mn(2+)-dependent dipeptidase [Vagococcus humatus]|uniref:Peptidase M20 n=1 Tax=Vagococcus humatus TaxID=1889241 RepID=A0A429Z5U9_9ENTE|nr:Sapep family Mn(2+)-dependent dipeptidase [Vagococcus humatus]RST89067.1 peptidase M20 [Vagococcus humatus]